MGLSSSRRGCQEISANLNADPPTSRTCYEVITWAYQPPLIHVKHASFGVVEYLSLSE